MRFYIVDDQYIKYLKTVDHKVPNNYDATKPFVGIVLEINGFKYLAPLTSYKSNQDGIDNSSPLCVKMHEQGKPDNKLGMIQLNNMIPVVDHVIAEFDMQSRDIKYQNLVNNQLVYIKTVKADIEKKAAKLYRLVCEKKVYFYVNMSCRFQDLEGACLAYAPAAPASDATVVVVAVAVAVAPAPAPTPAPAVRLVDIKK